MYLLRDCQNGSLCAMCCFEARLIRIMEVVLSEIERQLIVDSVFMVFKKKK